MTIEDHMRRLQSIVGEKINEVEFEIRAIVQLVAEAERKAGEKIAEDFREEVIGAAVGVEFYQTACSVIRERIHARSEIIGLEKAEAEIGGDRTMTLIERLKDVRKRLDMAGEIKNLSADDYQAILASIIRDAQRDGAEKAERELADFKKRLDEESAFLSRDDLVATLVERAQKAEAERDAATEAEQARCLELVNAARKECAEINATTVQEKAYRAGALYISNGIFQRLKAPAQSKAEKKCIRCSGTQFQAAPTYTGLCAKCWRHDHGSLDRQQESAGRR